MVKTTITIEIYAEVPIDDIGRVQTQILDAVRETSKKIPGVVATEFHDCPDCEDCGGEVEPPAWMDLD